MYSMIIFFKCYFLFQQRYAHNPLSLYQIVQQCLTSEMHLVQRAEGVSISSKVDNMPALSACCILLVLSRRVFRN